MLHTSGAVTKNTKYVNSLLLIKEIKKHEILYNKECKGYHRTKKHEGVWKEIHKALFPNFDTFSQQYQNAIRTTVDKRWKTMRDSLVRALRKKFLDPRKLETPQMKALAFMIPYVTHGSDYEPTPSNYNEDTGSDDRSYDQSSLDNQSSRFMPSEGTSCNETAYDYGDLTNKYDGGTVSDGDDVFSIKSEAYEITFNELPDRTSMMDNEEDSFTASSYKDKGLSYNEFSPEQNASNDECIFVHSDTEDSPKTVVTAPICQPPPVEFGISPCGRNDVHVNVNVFELLKKATMDAQDEDRMFLLSVLSDFKRVSPQNKVNVKMKIVQAIVEGIPTNSSQ